MAAGLLGMDRGTRHDVDVLQGSSFENFDLSWAVEAPRDCSSVSGVPATIDELHT